MGEFVVGDVVVVAFPYSDLSDSKRRPAFVAAVSEHDDLILCQITSRPYSSASAIRLDGADFRSGGLGLRSYVRPDKLFTASESVIVRGLGSLVAEKQREVRGRIGELFS